MCKEEGFPITCVVAILPVLAEFFTAIGVPELFLLLPTARDYPTDT
jgi:hypothetical protein